MLSPAPPECRTDLRHASGLLAAPVRAGLRLWEIVLLSAVIQWGDADAGSQFPRESCGSVEQYFPP